jgi:FMN-dependent NADH-azoreductase
MKVLQIDSSILGSNSVSRDLTAAVVEQLKRGGETVELVHRDLAAAPLSHISVPDFPTDHPMSAMAPAGDGRDESQKALEEFLAADTVVIGAPMYNFTLPSQLKSWIDRILVPGKTFAYSADGVKGLVGDKRVIVVVSRGGLYGPGAPAAAFEHAETYLRGVFGFIGVTRFEVIVAEGLNTGDQGREAGLAGAREAISALAEPALA